MDRAPVPIYIKDADRRYTLANHVAHEMAGLEPGALIGQGGTYEAEETLQVGDQERAFLTVKFPFVDDDGRIAGISGISADITEKKHADELIIELARAQERAIEVSASRMETVDRLSKAIERHDADTGEHINRMATVAAFLDHLSGLRLERVQLLRAAAPMHDVGKVATPDGVLRKPGPLTAEERMVMERHTVVGHGYPRGLRGEQIPLEGRIVAVADVFDALLSDRTYRPAKSVEETTEIFREGRGAHFDPTLVDLLLDHLEEALSLRG